MTQKKGSKRAPADKARNRPVKRARPSVKPSTRAFEAKEPAAHQVASDSKAPAAHQVASDSKAPAADQPASDSKAPAADQIASDSEAPAADQPASDSKAPAPDHVADDSDTPAPDQVASLPVEAWLPPSREPVPAEDSKSDEAPVPPETSTSLSAERWLVAADLASLAVIGSLAFLNIAGIAGIFRVILALVFVTCVPGWALARVARLTGGLTGVAVAVLASLTISAAASIAMVWLDVWHPLMLLAIIGGASAVAILWTLPPAFVAARLRT